MRLTRRTFLFRTSAGAAAIGALVVGPQILAPQATVSAAAQPSSSPTQTGAATNTRMSSEPVVAYVRDAARGEIALYVGAREIIRHDPELVSRLLQVM